jgi:hypothetical protein
LTLGQSRSRAMSWVYGYILDPAAVAKKFAPERVKDKHLMVRYAAGLEQIRIRSRYRLEDLIEPAVWDGDDTTIIWGFYQHNPTNASQFHLKMHNLPKPFRRFTEVTGLRKAKQLPRWYIAEETYEPERDGEKVPNLSRKDFIQVVDTVMRM